jgi:hypothetical protein
MTMFPGSKEDLTYGALKDIFEAEEELRKAQSKLIGLKHEFVYKHMQTAIDYDCVTINYRKLSYRLKK